MRDIAVAPARASGFFSALAPRGKAVFFALAAIAVCLLFAFPVFWLVLTSLRPGTGVYYVHRGTEFTIDNFHEVLSQEIVVGALFNSFMISTLATVFSLGVTATSGYMLSRFRGRSQHLVFVDLHFSLCALCRLGVAALFRDAAASIFDSYWGLLLPHIAVHICFFSWIMKGFFDGIDPSMEYAAMIDGCSRWGAFWRVAMPAAVPGLTALAILCWLYTWNEFLFALILTAHETPIVTVVMAQFVHELGMEWHLMSATAVIALVPALVVTLFGQRYVIRGLRI